MILKFGGMSPRKGYEVAALFDDVGGLIQGAPVRYMGVERGKVAEIHVIPWQPAGEEPAAAPGYKVKVVMSIDRRLRTEDEIKIVPDSLLGEKVVEIIPGPFDAPYLATGAEVQGINPEELFGEVRRSLGFLGDEKTQSNLKTIIANLRDVTGNIEKWTGDDLRSPVRTTVTGLSDAVDDFRSVLADLREAVKKFTGAGEEAQRLLAENREQISVLLGSLDVTLKSFERVADGLYPVVKEVKAGKGTLGRIISDPSWYVNFNKLLMALRTQPLLHLYRAYQEEQDQLKRAPVETRVWVM